MRAALCFLAAFLLLCALPQRGLAQQESKLVDEDSPEALLLVRITEENDAARRQTLLEEFAVKYPNHEVIVWVLDQLLTVYVDKKESSKAMATGERMLKLEPSNIHAAHACFKLVEATREPDNLLTWHTRALQVAKMVVKSKGPEPDEDPVDWKKRVEFAKEVETYLEYALFSAIGGSKDPKAKALLTRALEERYPTSKYLPSLRSQEYVSLRIAGNQTEAVQAAERLIQKGEGTIDMYLLLANTNFQKNTEKCVHYATKIIEVLQGRRPENVREEEWARKRSVMLGQAYYMLGTTYAGQEKYSQADKYLRSALNLIRGDEQLLAGTLFYLGYANFRLAENSADKTRVLDAVKYTEQCLNIKGGMQAAAAKNLEAIKTQYNLQ